MAYISDVRNLRHLTLLFVFENISFDHIEAEWVELQRYLCDHSIDVRLGRRELLSTSAQSRYLWSILEGISLPELVPWLRKQASQL